MGEETLAPGDSVQIVGPRNDQLWRVDVLDGQEARITKQRTTAPAGGAKLQPGEYALVRARGRQTRWLHAVGAAVTFERQVIE